MKKLTVLLLCALLLLVGTTSAFADDTWPNDTIHIVVHSDVGGGLDLFARALQPYLQKELGVAVVVENVTGGSGRVGTTHVWNSANDGYTLLMHQIPMTTIGDVFMNADYNILEFEYIYAFDLAPYVIAVSADNNEINNMEDLVKIAKTRNVINSCSGVGGAMWFQAIIMQSELDMNLAMLPFNGSSTSLMALLTGDAEICVVPYDVPLSNLSSYKIIATLADERLECYPDVPTATEQGYGFSYVSTRRSLVAPKGTDAAIVEKLADAVEAAMAYPEFQAWAEKNGVSMDPLRTKDYYESSVEYYQLVESYLDLYESMK